MSDYDERYYREWSHELPPFMHPMREVEVDVHHSITPSLSSDSEAMRLLLRDARTLRWPVGARGRVVERFKALAPIDQVVHAAVHTFGDSDLALRLREVMDFDWLYRRLLAEARSTAAQKIMADPSRLSCISQFSPPFFLFCSFPLFFCFESQVFFNILFLPLFSLKGLFLERSKLPDD